jgi:hypothetical protein
MPEVKKGIPVSSTAITVRLPVSAQFLPDNGQWTNRFTVKSESSDRLYVVAQNIAKRHWGCDCPGWRTRRKCKHLEAIGLPAFEKPFEAKLVK